MAYRIDSTNNDIVIDGWENGIADNPYEGISDMRNVTIGSIPGEAEVNFKTFRANQLAKTTTFTVDTTTDLITVASTTNLNKYTAVTFTTTTTLPSTAAYTDINGNARVIIVTNTPYWLKPISGSTYEVYPTPNLSGTKIDFTTTGTGTHTLTAITMTTTTYIDVVLRQVLIDATGLAWGRIVDSSNIYWVYLGNNTPTQTNSYGAGIITYRNYLFVFRRTAIDYIHFTDPNNIATSFNTNWTFGWNPATGGSGANPLNASGDVPHRALVGQDDVVYYCDASYIGSFFEKPNQTFDPTNTATFTFASRALTLPRYETARALAELGVNLLVGGIRNAIYPWNRTATSFTYPLLIGDDFIWDMITVNTNTYVIAGHRGRIYVTNGTNAQLFKKIPDHLNGTVEPYYFSMSNQGCFYRNSIYFSFIVENNAQSSTLANTGGIWAINIDNGAIRLANQLSYGTYAGWANAISVNGIVTNDPITGVSNGTEKGIGLIAGWNSSITFGLDEPTATDGTGPLPYFNSEAYIDSDLIPIATILQPKTFKQVEFKLSQPMVSGESVSLYYRLDFSQTYTLIKTFSWNEVISTGDFSNQAPVNFQNAQWVQIRAVLNSTNTSPSFVRLRELRLR